MRLIGRYSNVKNNARMNRLFLMALDMSRDRTERNIDRTSGEEQFVLALLALSRLLKMYRCCGTKSVLSYGTSNMISHPLT